MTLLRHPDIGNLRVRDDTLQLPNDGHQRLTTWFPADEQTRATLQRASRPVRLRVVRPA